MKLDVPDQDTADRHMANGIAVTASKPPETIKLVLNGKTVATLYCEPDGLDTVFCSARRKINTLDHLRPKVAI
jgi:hypothetical protein